MGAGFFSSSMRKINHHLLLPTLLLLIFWGSRLPALDALPLHNDEGLHLFRAIQVWDLHPFWQIDDGKIINHWLIAFFMPQNAPVFSGRIATIFTGMLGLAASYAIAQRDFDLRAALLASGLWLTSPYLFFYERLALSDAQAGAWVMVTIWAALRLARHNRTRDAMLTGVVLGLAALFKLTAAPFILSVAVIILLIGNTDLRQRLTDMLAIGAIVMLLFSIPVAYLALRGTGLFDIALAWINPSGSSSESLALTANLERMAAQLFDFGNPLPHIIMLTGLALLIITGRNGRMLLLAVALPVLAIVTLGSEVMPRHYVVALPFMFTLAGVGLSAGMQKINASRWQAIITGIILFALVSVFVPFMRTAFQQPANLKLPLLVRQQYVTEHSAGFGLLEAVAALPQVVTLPDTPIIGSMTRDSCRRANFYAETGLVLQCVNAPGSDEIMRQLEDNGVVYVLVEETPGIGADVTTFNARALRIAAYPRPGETIDSASVTLWLLEKAP